MSSPTHDFPFADSPVRLAIDLGASSGRIMASWFDGDCMRLAEVHRFENRPVPVAGSLQWDLLALWESILDGLNRLGRSDANVLSIGCDSWGVDYVLLRSDGLVAGPAFNHRDRRTEGMVAAVSAKVSPERLYDASGLQVLPINTVYQLAADRRVEPSSLDIAHYFMMIGDYFHYLLSGSVSIEATNASTTGLLDPRTRRWRSDLMDELSIPRSLFAPVQTPGSTVGTLTDEVAARTGLSNVDVIAPATHDTASAVLSVPVGGGPTEDSTADASWCYISCGTWSLMGIETTTPIIDETARSLNFTNEGGVGNTTRVLKNIGGLWVFQQIRASLARQGVSVDWNDMVTAASDAVPLAVLVDPDDAELHAADDMVDAVNRYVDRTGQPPIESRGQMYRASLEGLALRYRYTLEQLQQMLGHRIEIVHIVGGGCQNRMLCQMTADACDRVVVAGPGEATAIGNALVQWMADGRIESIAAARDVVRRSFETLAYRPAENRGRWDEAFERFTYNINASQPT